VSYEEIESKHDYLKEVDVGFCLDEGVVGHNKTQLSQNFGDAFISNNVVAFRIILMVHQTWSLQHRGSKVQDGGWPGATYSRFMRQLWILGLGFLSTDHRRTPWEVNSYLQGSFVVLQRTHFGFSQCMCIAYTPGSPICQFTRWTECCHRCDSVVHRVCETLLPSERDRWEWVLSVSQTK